MSKHSAGKGDKYRKVDLNTYRENWDLIFNKTKKKKVKQNGSRNGSRNSNG